MFNPRYRILITAESFPQDQCIGLGVQLASIVHSIGKYVPPHTWYGADVEAARKHVCKYTLNTFKPNPIGSDLEFTEYCSGVEQFIWGVFLCLGGRFSGQDIREVEIETEDDPFRPIHCNGILVEIRTFDTSYFEIYAEDFELITKISKSYSLTIEAIL